MEAWTWHCHALRNDEAATAPIPRHNAVKPARVSISGVLSRPSIKRLQSRVRFLKTKRVFIAKTFLTVGELSDGRRMNGNAKPTSVVAGLAVLLCALVLPSVHALSLYPYPGFCNYNEVYRSCGGCEGTCANPNPICTLQCRAPRCVCRTGYVRHNGNCVPVKSCPIACGQNEVYNGCGGCEGNVYQPQPNLHSAV